MSSSFGIDPPSGTAAPVLRYGASHLLVLGVIDVVCGLIALVWPGVTVLALALVFGFLLLLAGLLALGVGSVIRRAGGSPAISWVVGAVAVVAGLVCIVHPGAGVWAIILGCSLWFLMTGVGDLLVASGMSGSGSRHRWWFVVLGGLSIVAAIVLLARPGVAVVTVALVAGIAFLVRGAGELGLGLSARRAAG